jgi:hypothetical protein
MESDVEDPMDFSKEVTWEDDSEKTKSLLTKACTCRLNNSMRLSHRSSHPLPKVPATRTPQLDPVMKSETSAAVKAVDKELARIQTFVLDALAPLTTLLEEEEQTEQVVEAATAAVQLIGNASAKLSHLWREKVTKHINEALMPIVQEEGNFKDAPPQLFWSRFCQKSQGSCGPNEGNESHTAQERSEGPIFSISPPSQVWQGWGPTITGATTTPAGMHL